MNHSFEIEIKSLLGDKEKAEKLVQNMRQKDKSLTEVGSHKQLNHYFIKGNLHNLSEKVSSLLPDEKRDQLQDLAEKARDFSVRTRWADGKVILVVKASVDDTTSSNGTARLEWESRVDKTIEEMDTVVLAAGFEYQAKWSRERQEYIYHPHGRAVNVSIDKNAGYGYLSEFEVVIQDESKSEEVKSFIRETMRELEISELPQDRLARMFEHYNKNWREYYGTENIFTVE